MFLIVAAICYDRRGKHLGQFIIRELTPTHVKFYKASQPQRIRRLSRVKFIEKYKYAGS